MYYPMPDFDKNIIIPDEIFFDTKKITKEIIQKILDDHNSILKNYKVDGALVSEVIYNLGIKYNLNPAILLARIQTESSAITKSINKDRFDWILGVGCPNKTTRIEKYRGFDKQLEQAAYKLGRQYLYEKPFLNGASLPEKMIVENHAGDGEKWVIQPKTKAAYALYTYNPEIGVSKFDGNDISGNYLFYLVFKRYFGLKK